MLGVNRIIPYHHIWHTLSTNFLCPQINALRFEHLTYMVDRDIINSDIVTYEPPNMFYMSETITIIESSIPCTRSSNPNLFIESTSSCPTTCPAWCPMVWLNARRWLLMDQRLELSGGEWIYWILNEENVRWHLVDHPSQMIEIWDGICYKYISHASFVIWYIDLPQPNPYQ